MGFRLFIIEEAPHLLAAQLSSELPSEAEIFCEDGPWGPATLEKIEAAKPRLVVALAAHGQSRAMELLHWLYQQRLAVPTLAVIPENSDDEIVRAAYEATDDFVFWPFRSGELRRRVERMLGVRAQDAESVACRLTREMGLSQLAGEHPGFREILNQIPIIARSDAPALLAGETGTGKEVCARAIHHLGPRANFPFVPVECAALPDHLAENELFGHARGAYTDARQDQKGLAAMAEGGTLFLDEIDALSLSAQAKVLRFLQDGTYRPLGAERFVRADLRVIAATNRDLETLVRRQEFRSDLYFRLNVLQLRLPPLRERLTDIRILARHFLESEGSGNGLSKKSLSLAALRKLEAYKWPGNIRELRNVIQRAVVFVSGRQILPSDLALPSCPEPSPPMAMNFRKARRQMIESFERNYVEHLLRRHGGNVTRAAIEAGKDRRAFGRLIKKYGVDRVAFFSAGSAPTPLRDVSAPLETRA